MNKKLLIQKENLFQEFSQAHRDLTVLYEVSNALRTSLELTHILYIILTGVTSHTGLGYNRAIIFLVNNQTRCLEPKMAIGPESGEDAQKIWEYASQVTRHIEDLIREDKIVENAINNALFNSIKNLKIPLTLQNEKENGSGGLLAKAFHQGITMHIPKSDIHVYADDPLIRQFKTTELVIMPLFAKDKVNGLIVADNLFTQKAITENDLKIFMMLANQAGLAIENSQLYEVVIQRSQIDSLTGLWNHGYFQNQLNKEIETHKNNKYSLALIIMDIDNFKKLNDTYGPQNGDVLLKEIAKAIKESSRDIDYVCRYGGEEFSIILTQTNKEQGLAIAERLRHKIEFHTFPGFLQEQNIKITVSLGLAVFPEDGITKERLIEQADKAMYIAKFGGKNQTCCAS